MKQILDSYFERADKEAFEFLQVIAWFPVLFIVWIFEGLRGRVMELREWAGRKIVLAALFVFPHRSLFREYVTALLGEHRRYARYQGWCLLVRTGSLSFEEWRRESARLVWLQRKTRVGE
jgi:hypothetical protein